MNIKDGSKKEILAFLKKIMHNQEYNFQNRYNALKQFIRLSKKMIPSFYNTINQSGQVLMDFEGKAKSQQELVFSVYRFALRPLAWNEVESLLAEPMNQVSIKRCITNLYKEGLLTKTETMVKGIYGKPCHQYKLR